MIPTTVETTRTWTLAVGRRPKRNQLATKARPARLRNDSIETTSTPPVNMNFASTSEMPSEVPAAIPGASRCMRSRSGSPSAIVRRGGLSAEQSAGAELGEQLEQHRVRYLAVQNDDGFDAVFERIDAGLDLGNHAAGNRSVGDQAARFVGGQLFDQLFRLVEYAGNVGEQQQTLGLERAGNCAGKGVGIDVESAAVGARRDRRQDRNQLAAENLIEHGGVDLLRLADKSKIDDFLNLGTRVDDGARELARCNHIAVLAAQPDRLAAGLVDVADHLLVDGSGQNHFNDFERLFVGDAQTIGELRFDADALEHGFDLRATAMHHHRINGRLFQKHDVAGEFARQMLVAHSVPAILHHDGRFVVALHIRQGFRQDLSLLKWRHVHEGTPLPDAAI